MTQEYKEYLKSAEWKEKRDRRLEVDGCQCVICGSKNNLNVHHLTYKNIMQEDVENDLITLCKNCHTMLHRIKEQSSYEYKRSGECKVKKKHFINKLHDLAAVEIWQRDKYLADGDCKIFDTGCKMLRSLVTVVSMIYPELKYEACELRDDLIDTLRRARAMRICQMYREGQDINQIANELGMNDSNVHKILKRHGFNQTARIK